MSTTDEPVALNNSIADIDVETLESYIGTVFPREEAEIAFALAMIYHEGKLTAKARSWCLRSIDLFNQCDTSTETKCVPLHQVISGMQMPDRVHEGVVRCWAQRRGIVL